MYIMFDKIFIPKIESLIKTSTIRNKKRLCAGDKFEIRHWRGRPYLTKHVIAGKAVCASVIPVEVSKNPWGRIMCWDEHNCRFIDCWKQEGFESHADMNDWFVSNTSLPFKGWMHNWTGFVKA